MSLPDDKLRLSLAGKKAIVVASTGGHLEQAVRWSNRLGLHSDSIFVTFKSQQAISLLADRRHTYVPYVSPRDFRGIFRVMPSIDRLARSGGFDSVLTTGAGIALAAYVPAVVHRLDMSYVESVSRFEGPSLTGRIVSKLPGVTTYTQHARYASKKWNLVSGLLADYSVVPPSPAARPPRRFLVTLGTIKPYRFDSLVGAVLRSSRPGDEFIWQVGVTDRTDLPGDVHEMIPAAELDTIAAAADTVITHAGVGSILRMLDLGISPIVVPRLRRRGEHVDDHQLQVAMQLAALGLIACVDADELDEGSLHTPRGSVVNGVIGGQI